MHHCLTPRLSRLSDFARSSDCADLGKGIGTQSSASVASTNKKVVQRPEPYPDEEQRGAAKASVIASLKPILQPRLSEYDISWDEAAPVLDRLTIGLLSTALADANVQPVLAKLRAAAYLSPSLKKLGSSDDLRKKPTATSCSLETALRAGPPAVAV